MDRRVIPHPTLQRLALASGLAVCGLSGCVSIREAPIAHSDWAICDAPIAEPIAPIAGPIEPIAGPIERVHAVPVRMCEQSMGWIRGLWYGCADKIEQKRAEANAPPWPRFHPVPTQPAFTDRQMEGQSDPEAWGAFISEQP